MKKAIIYFLAAVILPLALRGQDSLGVALSPEYLAVMADTCRPPSLVAKAVINYEAYSRAYLEFEGAGEGQAFGYRLLDATEGGQAVSTNSEILLEGLLPDEIYEVTAIDNCGKEIVVAVLSTFADNPSIRGIEVSDRMYKAIVAFQQQEGTVTLSQYLSQAEGVSPYEKLSFLQQYYHKGQKLQFDLGPTPPPPPPPPPAGECLCNFIFNTSQNALPGTMMPDGSIRPSVDDSDGKIDLPDNAHWWWATWTKGAAKWNAIWSEGWHAGNTQNTVTTEVINNINASPYMGQVSFNLLCTNYAELPRDCDCTKPLKLYYRYDTQVTAYANRDSGGLLEKKSRAASQDIGVVTLRNGNADVEVLAAGDVRAEAECNWDVNEDYWIEVIEVAGSIAGFFVNENSTQLPDLINTLADQLGDLITTDFYTDTDCDANATLTETLANDITEIEFHPNQAVYLDVFSFSNLMCGGKRSWFSWANINSDFYAAGIVPGGFLSEGEDHCCTQKIGSWVLASSERPYTTAETAAAVGFYFGTEGPWGMPAGPGNITRLTEWGWDAVVVEERCIKQVNPGNTGNGGGGIVGDGTGSRSSDAPFLDKSIGGDEARFVVFDTSGRIVFSGASMFDKIDAVSRFRESAGEIPTGLYILQLTDGQKKETIKVFYSR